MNVLSERHKIQPVLELSVCDFGQENITGND